MFFLFFSKQSVLGSTIGQKVTVLSFFSGKYTNFEKKLLLYCHKNLAKWFGVVYYKSVYDPNMYFKLNKNGEIILCQTDFSKASYTK